MLHVFLLNAFAGAQPYNLYVSPAAEVLMDFHAHLSMNEVIGMLAGVFDPASRTIRSELGGWGRCPAGSSQLVENMGAPLECTHDAAPLLVSPAQL